MRRFLSLGVFRISRASRIALLLAPLLLGALVSFILWIPPALREINEEYVAHGDPFIGSQIAFASGVCVSLILLWCFLQAKKQTPDVATTKRRFGYRWLALYVLFSVGWLTTVSIGAPARGSRPLELLKSLFFLGLLATIVFHVREVRARHRGDATNSTEPPQ